VRGRETAEHGHRIGLRIEEDHMAKVSGTTKRRMRIYVALGTAVVLILGGYFADRAFASGGDPAVKYVTQAAQTMTLTSSVSGTGNITLPDSASVSPSVSGEVTGLSVQVGDQVKKGQVLFDLVNPQLGLDVTNAQDTLNQNEAGVVKAELTVDQDQQSLDQLRDSGTATALQIDVAREQVTADEDAVATAKGQVSSAQFSLTQAKTAAAEAQVTAPMSGTVTAVNVTNGDQLGGGTSSASSGSSAASSSASSSQAALVITDTTHVEAVVSLAETDVPNVKVGQKATLTFDALPDLTLAGKVTEIDTSGTVNQGVVSYNATIVPDTSDPSVKGGMTVTAAIITQVASDVLVVPNSAVKSQGGTSYVQILTNGQPVDQTVEVGISNDSYTQITSGLSAGEQVVTQTISTSSSTSGTTGTGSSLLGGSSSRLGGSTSGFGSGTGSFGSGAGAARTTGGG
jgi:macrolide-specific efflux system membrane fusion protein